MIHDRVADAAVVAVVTTDYPRRPAVVSKATAGDTAQHAVDEAPAGEFGQQAQVVQKSATPHSQRMEYSA